MSREHNDEKAARVAAWVAAYVAVTGRGPTWLELSHAQGWGHHRPKFGKIIRKLAESGWITVGGPREPGSMRPGPTFAELGYTGEPVVSVPAFESMSAEIQELHLRKRHWDGGDGTAMPGHPTLPAGDHLHEPE